MCKFAYDFHLNNSHSNNKNWILINFNSYFHSTNRVRGFNKILENFNPTKQDILSFDFQ